MNIYAIIVLAAILLDFILDAISEILNLKHLNAELPPEFNGVYTPERYAKSQEYTRVRTKFGFIVTIFSLGIMLIFWFSGGFDWLDSIVRSWCDTLIFQGLIYIGLLLLANSIISLPFSIYSTFVIEEKFGFNKTTSKTFILDTLKSLILSIIIGGPLLAVVIFILDEAGSYAWLYGWAAVVAISLFMHYIAPTWIMPLFNKFTPLEDGDLKKSIMDYSDIVKFPLKNVYVMDGSKRSAKSNAFFTGFGKNKRIALFDTLIARHSVGEIVAVLAHEIGHYKKKHILKSMIISILHYGLLFYLLQIFLTHKELYDAFYVSVPSIYTGLIFFGMLYSPVETILSILMNIFSRKNEFEADRFAVETTSDGTNLIDALKKLAEHNLSNLTPHPFYVFINYSHPPVLERIKAIKSQIT